jgi:hypothetical protein
MVEDPEMCKRLYRRVAYLCHPDRNPPEAELFPHLVDHRHDRLWLEAMQGALEPLGSDFIHPQPAESVSMLFDRLFSLHSTCAKLLEKINALQAEVDSYGGTWTACVDDEIKRRETILRVVKFDIDQAWRILNSLVGKEPFHN